MNPLFELFITFAKIGSLTFGGGYAMLPLLQKEIVDNKKWVTKEEIMDYYAIGQCTPGLIAINTATFIGYKREKISGAIVATLGFIVPSLFIICIIAAFISNFSNLEVVKNAFSGIRICVSVLILNAVVKLFKSSVIDKITLVIFLTVLIANLLINCSPIIFIFITGLFGILIKNVGDDKK